MFNIEKLFIYFVLTIFLTAIIYIFFDYRNNLKLPQIKKQLENNNYSLLLSLIISIIIVFILIYIKEK
jgi:heme/copper-type cytochrome/quinol oxidase subunit 2